MSCPTNLNLLSTRDIQHRKHSNWRGYNLVTIGGIFFSGGDYVLFVYDILHKNISHTYIANRSDYVVVTCPPREGVVIVFYLKLLLGGGGGGTH